MSKRTERFYNMFAFSYPLVDLFLKPQKRRLFREINSLPSGRLLDIGVGNGKHLSLYTKHQITGIDTSSAMLSFAEKQQLPAIELLQMNGESLQFDDHSFDYIVLSHVLSVADNPEKLLEETYRVLKPGGKVFILNHFTPDNWLRYVDRSFQPFSRILHFRSVFRIQNVAAIRHFTLLQEINIGRLSYFKLLIYGKA